MTHVRRFEPPAIRETSITRGVSYGRIDIDTSQDGATGRQIAALRGTSGRFSPDGCRVVTFEER